MLYNKKASHEAFLFSVLGDQNLGLPLPVEIPNSHDEAPRKVRHFHFRADVISFICVRKMKSRVGTRVA
jgi:hypothetical protein